MSLTVLGLAALAALGGGYLVRRRLRSGAASRATRSTVVPRPHRGSDPNHPFAALPIALGDVVEHAGETRWLRSALVLRAGGRTEGVILLAREEGRELAVVELAPPARAVYWVEAAPGETWTAPPSRLEIAGALLDRRVLLPVHVERHGDGEEGLAHAELGDEATLATYEGALGCAAVLLVSPRAARLWNGRRVEPGRYEILGASSD
jgi:hypothetical protein